MCDREYGFLSVLLLLRSVYIFDEPKIIAYFCLQFKCFTYSLYISYMVEYHLQTTWPEGNYKLRIFAQGSTSSETLRK